MSLENKVEILIELIKKGTGATDAANDLEKLEKQSAKSKTAVDEFTTIFKRALVAFGAVEIIKSSVEAFAEQEQAVAKLNGILKASGQYSNSYSRELQDLSESLQRVTKFSKDSILGVQSLLLSFGAAGRDIPKLTELVLDLASGMGMDINTAALVMGKAIAGEFQTLSRYGILISDAGTRSEKTAEAIKQMQQRFGGLARGEADTLTGSLTQTSNAIKDLKEVFGEFILVGLDPFVKKLREAAEAAGALKSTSPGMSTGINDARREALEKELAAQTMSDQHPGGTITPEAAQMERYKLLKAFRGHPEKVSTIGFGTASAIATTLGGGFWPALVTEPFASVGVGPNTTVMKRDLSEEDKALNSLRNLLRPDLAPKEHENPFARANPEQKKAIEELGKLEDQMRLGTLTGIEKEKAAANVAYQERAEQIAKLAHTGEIAAERKAGLDQLNAAELKQSLDDIQAKQDESEAKEAEHFQAKLARIREERIRRMDAEGPGIQQEFEKLTLNHTQLLKLEYERRKQFVSDYYDFEISQAREDTEKVAALESQKSAHLKALTTEETHALDDMYQGMKQIGQIGAQQFSSGLASAFVSIIDGSKSAGQALQEFAANFLKNIAEMIMQLVIFSILKKTLGGPLGLFGAGGSASAPTGGFPSSGTITAAGGVAGVSEINSPTFFPNFNVLAGEAGREVMTVMARPQFMDIGGMSAVVGNVGPNRIAMVNAMDLLGRARPAAAGGVFDLGVSAAGGVGGQAVVEIRLTPGLEAAIIQQSIAGAVVKVTREISTDSATSQAVKRLVT